MPSGVGSWGLRRAMQPPTGKPVLLQTERLELRSLKPSDASERWVGWARDPEVMGPLNPVRPISRDDFWRGMWARPTISIGIWSAFSTKQAESTSDFSWSRWTTCIASRHQFRQPGQLSSEKRVHLI
jgi:hypothetical protein